MLVLPPTWPAVGTPAFATANGSWPYVLLQDLARLPHEFATTLGPGHTVPNGDPPAPYAPNTRLCGALLARPLIEPKAFASFSYDDRTAEMLAVYPLHAAEMDSKLEQGLDALYDRLDAADITEILDVDRASVAQQAPKRRRWLGR